MVVAENGTRLAQTADGSWQEVMVATLADVGRLPVSLPEGVYVLGTGSTGAAMTFATLSCGYAVAMTAGALLMRLPPAGYVPKGFLFCWKNVFSP